MAHRLTTAATTAIFSAAEARVHCRIDDSGDDAYLDSLIKRATLHCEAITKRAFVTQTWTLTMDGFADCRYVTDGIIYVPRPPLIAVSSIAYLDTNGTSQTLASSAYRVDANNIPGRIEEAYGEVWPSTRGVVGDVTITHTAGYGAAKTSVPEDIRHAILLLVGHWYEHREASMVGAVAREIEMAVTSLLDPYVMEAYA